MNGKTLLLLALMAGAMTACQPSRTKLHEQITSMETRLYSPSASGFSKASADSLADLYSRYAGRFPSDTLSPHYLFRAAGIAMNLQEGAKAIGFYDKVLA